MTYEIMPLFCVSEFNHARGHKMERQNYINELRIYEKYPLQFRDMQTEKPIYGHMRRHPPLHHRDRYYGSMQHREYPNFGPNLGYNGGKFIQNGGRASKNLYPYRRFTPNVYDQNTSHHFTEFAPRNKNGHYFNNVYTDPAIAYSIPPHQGIFF